MLVTIMIITTVIIREIAIIIDSMNILLEIVLKGRNIDWKDKWIEERRLWDKIKENRRKNKKK